MAGLGTWFVFHGTTKAEVKGLDKIPHDQWPTALRSAKCRSCEQDNDNGNSFQ